MKTMTGTNLVCGKDSSEPQPRRNGFSLLELIVAMGIFMLISGFALTLFRDQQIASMGLTGQVGLNLSLRNAVAQMQMDLANAGSGYYQNINMPSWPVGVTIVNNVVPQGNSCYTAGTLTYGADCFDQLNIISGVSPAIVPPINATGPVAQGNCSKTESGNAYGQAAVFPNGTVDTPAQTAALFQRGDQLLLVSNSGTQIGSVVLTQNPVVSNGMVKFTFNRTNADGTNTRTNDPMDITTCEGHSPCSLPKVTNQFCSNDWIMKLSTILYKVDSSDPTNPQLKRQVGSNGNPETVMEQVIGFKIGATLWNNGLKQFADQGEYVYDSATYCNDTCTSPPTNPGDMAYNFTLVRSVRVSLIGRTTPDWRGTYVFRNGFDNGPYQVQGVAVVVNPRNMSMND